ncbi:MAG TPA: hypothetical protein VGL93_25315 [Streptosporangiaceae bacterium]|jgi:hypothetical protein
MGLVLASVLPAGASATAGQDPKLRPAARAAGARADTKVWLKTWASAPSYWYYASASDNSRAGTLNGGSNYFYCQAAGAEYSAHGYRNYYWARTDDDTGNKGVWVSDVYITTGGQDQPVPGLPMC